MGWERETPVKTLDNLLVWYVDTTLRMAGAEYEGTTSGTDYRELSVRYETVRLRIAPLLGDHAVMQEAMQTPSTAKHIEYFHEEERHRNPLLQRRTG